MKILVLGGASFDDIIYLDDFFGKNPGTYFARRSQSTPGSTGVGKAIALSKLGFDVTFQAVIGVDPYGEEISKAVKSHGVKFYPTIADKTERHTNIMNSKGERISIFTQMPEDFVVDVYQYEDYIKEADIVVLNINSYCKYFIPLLKKHKKTVFCDIHDYDGYEHHHKDFILNSEYIFMSSEKIENYEKYAKKLLDDGKKLVCVTHAEKGASLIDDSGVYNIQANKLQVVDTNGAGDNFFAGFLYGYLNQYSPKDCLYLGRIAAESCVMSNKIVSDDLSNNYLVENYKKLKNIVEKLYDIV